MSPRLFMLAAPSRFYSRPFGPSLLRQALSPWEMGPFLLVAGTVGVVALLAMWVAHWRLFWQPGLMAWTGLIAVTQNIVGETQRIGFGSTLGVILLVISLIPISIFLYQTFKREEQR